MHISTPKSTASTSEDQSRAGHIPLFSTLAATMTDPPRQASPRTWPTTPLATEPRSATAEDRAAQVTDPASRHQVDGSAASAERPAASAAGKVPNT